MTAVTVTDNGHNLMRDALKSVATYIALSTDTAAPTSGDTTLAGEVFRMSVSAATNGASVGEGLLNAVITSLQAAGVVIKKVGWFGGTASSLAGSGTLICAVLYTHTHGNESLQLLLDYTIT